jgi:hypothetical protein
MRAFPRFFLASLIMLSVQILLLPNASAQSPDTPAILASTSPPEPSLSAAATSPEASAAMPEPADPASPAPTSAASSNDGWHLAISPYIWFAGMHGNVGARGHEASAHASFGDVFKYLNFGLMGAVEARYNRIVIPVDFMWMKLSDDKALPVEFGPTSVKVKINEDILTPKIGYRVIDTGKLTVDGLVGFRYWHLGNTLTLEPQIANGFYASANWVDMLGGAKIQAALSPKAVVTILGDAGGGQANTDYQIAGLLGYKLKKVILQAGWRYMYVNYRPSSTFVYQAAMSGLILGVTIPLK